jgi:N-acetylmuramoyl-L-alanine amidase
MTNYKTLLPEAIRYIVIHCAATPPKMDIGRKEIDLWHRQRGFAEVGYHFIIRRSGLVEVGRPLTQPGAHAQGFNLLSWGICLVGGVDEAGAYGKADANYTEAQYEALSALVAELREKAPTAEVLGHRDLPSPHARLKDCPSFDTRHWFATGEVRP